MTTAKNDVTGDSIQSKTNSNAYRDNWDRLFGKKKPEDDEKEKDNGSKADNEKTDL